MVTRRTIPILAAVFVALALVTYLVMEEFVVGGAAPSDVTITIQGENFTLAVAATDAAIEQGLMGVTSIDDHGGMLFIFKRPRFPNFWMKNCLVDIDVLFLDELGKVVTTHEMKTQPPRREGESESAYENRLDRYPAARPVLFAVELKAGSIARLGVKPGDRVEMDLARLKRLAH